MVTKILTNTPFQAEHSKFVAYIPADVTATLNMSADGEHYDAIGEAIAGPETVQVNDCKPAVWMKFVSAADTDIKITL